MHLKWGWGCVGGLRPPTHPQFTPELRNFYLFCYNLNNDRTGQEVFGGDLGGFAAQINYNDFLSRIHVSLLNKGSDQMWLSSGGLPVLLGRRTRLDASGNHR